MDRGVVGCGCGAGGEGPGYDAAVYVSGAGKGVKGRGGGGAGRVRGHGGVWVAEGGFEGEGVGFEPVEEGGLAEDAGVGVLGGVDVGVWLWVRLGIVHTAYRERSGSESSWRRLFVQ